MTQEIDTLGDDPFRKQYEAVKQSFEMLKARLAQARKNGQSLSPSDMAALLVSDVYPHLLNEMLLLSQSHEGLVDAVTDLDERITQIEEPSSVITAEDSAVLRAGLVGARALIAVMREKAQIDPAAEAKLTELETTLTAGETILDENTLSDDDSDGDDDDDEPVPPGLEN